MAHLMIGPMSSSLALAQRTASKARATMDDMSRQIATGQKVSSVKDNGAAWARAAALKSQQATIKGREFIASALGTVIEAQTIQDDQTRAAFEWMADIVLRAKSHPAGGSARQQLNAEYQQAYQALALARGPTAPITSGDGAQVDGRYGIRGTTADTLISDYTVWTTLGRSVIDYGWQTVDYMSNGVPIQAIDILNGSQTNLSNGLANIRSAKDSHLDGHAIQNGVGSRWLNRVLDMSAAENDRLDTAIGALTDADMGKASTARANAETRQQLALSTISQAISAYGGYANGLLGNVQRTQRGVLA